MSDLFRAKTNAIHRGVVWCRACGRSQRVDVADCLRHGWPKCCGATMTIDSPAERRALKAKEARDGKAE